MKRTGAGRFSEAIYEPFSDSRVAAGDQVFADARFGKQSVLGDYPGGGRHAECAGVGAGGYQHPRGGGLGEHSLLIVDIGLRHALSEPGPADKAGGGCQSGHPQGPRFGKKTDALVIAEIAVFYAVRARLQGGLDPVRAVGVGHYAEALAVGDVYKLGYFVRFKASAHKAAEALKIHDPGYHQLDKIRFFGLGLFHEPVKVAGTVKGMSHDAAVAAALMSGEKTGAEFDAVFPGRLAGVFGRSEYVAAVAVVDHPVVRQCAKAVAYHLFDHAVPVQLHSLFIISAVHEDVAVTFAEHLPKPSFTMIRNKPVSQIIQQNKSRGKIDLKANGCYNDTGIRSAFYRAVYYEREEFFMKIRRVIAFAAALIMLTVGAAAAAGTENSGSYVALGDSIGAGYGLPGYFGDNTDPEGAYASIIAKEKGLSLNNLSVSGMMSSQLLDKLYTAEYADAVSGAELITISIGSNDILVPAMGIIMNSFMSISYGAYGGTGFGDITSSLEGMYNDLISDEGVETFENGCRAFEENWDKIISRIRELNDDAEIAVTGFYNPYSMLDLQVGLSDIKITSFVDGYIARLNETLANSAMKDEYVSADVADVTTNVRIFVLDPTQFSFDPHPDADGHRLIADRLLAAMEQERDAKPDTEPEPDDEPLSVMLSNQRVLLDGAEVNTEVYNINGSNYFKLRDIACLLMDKGAGFSVDYDSASRVIDLKKGGSYEPDGSELVIGEDRSATAVRSNQPVKVDGQDVKLTAYNLGGNNFFKLRDLGDALGFGVDYDSETRTVLIYGR